MVRMWRSPERRHQPSDPPMKTVGSLCLDIYLGSPVGADSHSHSHFVLDKNMKPALVKADVLHMPSRCQRVYQ